MDIRQDFVDRFIFILDQWADTMEELSLVVLMLMIHQCLGFRIYDKADLDELSTSPAYFVPYDKGFVGYYGEPENAQRERVNEGAPFTTAFPRIWEPDAARRTYGSKLNRIVTTLI